MTNKSKSSNRESSNLEDTLLVEKDDNLSLSIEHNNSISKANNMFILVLALNVRCVI
jgi:hypothetical protein